MALTMVAALEGVTLLTGYSRAGGSKHKQIRGISPSGGDIKSSHLSQLNKAAWTILSGDRGHQSQPYAVPEPAITAGSPYIKRTGGMRIKEKVRFSAGNRTEFLIEGLKKNIYY